MLFTVADECFQLGLRAGAIVFRAVHVTAADSALRSEITNEAKAVQARFSSPEGVRNLPEVVSYQGLLRRVGVNPRKEQPSVERLLNHVLKRGDLPAINNFVDAYNLMSIRSACSLGAHDLNRIATPVALRILNGTESFTPLGKNTATPITPGEYGYVDAGNRVLCRLDLLQAEFSKVTTETHNVLLIVEGTTVHAPTFLQQVFHDTIALIIRSCGGTAEIVAFPDANLRQME